MQEARGVREWCGWDDGGSRDRCKQEARGVREWGGWDGGGSWERVK